MVRGSLVGAGSLVAGRFVEADGWRGCVGDLDGFFVGVGDGVVLGDALGVGVGVGRRSR